MMKHDEKSTSKGQLPVKDLAILARYLSVRGASEKLCAPLARDDYQVQSADFVSPPKWHLAHTTWFFEVFVLAHFAAPYRFVDERYIGLFNSYYESLGQLHSRPRRGHVSRPTLEQILDYRHRIDERIKELLEHVDSRELAHLMLLGVNHEEQHQELLLMDIKHIFYMNPLRPSFWDEDVATARVSDSWLPTDAAAFVEVPSGLQRIGADGEGFSFDNEAPAHNVYIGSIAIANRPVTNAEYLEFIADGGYGEPLLWLSDGWAAAKSEAWQAPLYWELVDGAWQHFTLKGTSALDLQEPVCHVSYYEALAFAHWRGVRLPMEHEWEVARRAGCFTSGTVWEWTQSAYAPYPGYRVSRSALGEYNGKFMVNQMVLRGGAQFTPRDHARPSYRNFYQPQMRWQFSGIRLLEDR